MKILVESKIRRIKKKKLKKTWNGIPAFIKKSEPETSLYNHFFLAVLGHIVGSFLIWGLVAAFTFWGLAPILFHKPKPKIMDIEYILKDSSGRKSKSRRAKAPKISNEITPTVSSPVVNPEPNKKTAVKNQPIVKKNSARKSSKSAKSQSDFALPMPKIKPLSGGGFGGGFTSSSSGGSSGTASEHGSSAGNGSGGGTAGGNGFDKTATKKIIAAYDITPYINALKREIRWNWHAPKGHENKRVELFLRIAKDGKVVILNVKRTSEDAEIDNAALNAVRKTMPLNSLPTAYKKGYLDVVFSFDGSTSTIRNK